MAGTAQFTIGAQASCSDGACGKVTRVIVDPVAEAVTHLVVEPEHRQTPAGSSRLTSSTPRRARSGSAAPWPSSGSFTPLRKHSSYREPSATPATAPGQVSYWPYYGKGTGGRGTGGVGMGGAGPGTAGLGGRGMAGQNLSQTVTWDSIPPGEVEIRRGDHVQASDGHIGRVQGLVIDRRSGHVTHVLLQEGHLWSRREVAIPVSAVAGTGDGIKLTITKQEVGDLPPVDIDHPDGSTGGREGSV